MIDNWKHRSEGMTCKTCMYFVQKNPMVWVTAGLGAYSGQTGQEKVWSQATQAPEATITPKIIGRCRRHAPTMNGFPVVFASDFCGDHKLDENKV